MDAEQYGSSLISKPVTILRNLRERVFRTVEKDFGDLGITLYAADLYASINDAQEIWLCDPASPSHTRLYQSKGYTPVTNWRDDVTHLMLRLK